MLKNFCSFFRKEMAAPLGPVLSKGKIAIDLMVIPTVSSLSAFVAGSLIGYYATCAVF